MSDVILYIEDNDNNAKIVELILNRAGFETIVAENGDEGIQLAIQHKPSLIICDYHLPGVLKGIDILKTIRETPLLAETPFLMLTADSSTYPKSIEFGANAYLNKPVTPDQLIDNVNTLLRIR
jgi:CheY-like chemotaxis protein